jgi:hypothetical protein
MVPESFTKVYLEANKVVLEQQQYDIARAPRNDPKAKTLIENGVERMQQMLSDPVPWSDGLVLESDDDALEYKKVEPAIQLICVFC